MVKILHELAKDKELLKALHITPDQILALPDSHRKSLQITIDDHQHKELVLAPNENMLTVVHVTAMLGSHAQLVVRHYQKTGKLLCVFDYHLQGAYAEVQQYAYGALHTDAYQGLITRQYHLASHTKSELSINTVLDGNARSFYRGTILIGKAGQNSVAQQQHRALLLSDRAYACAIPSLEVAAHEVKCTHGTAASAIDELQLWHLKTRGLDDIRARQLLVRSFLARPEQSDGEYGEVVFAAEKRIEEGSHV